MNTRWLGVLGMVGGAALTAIEVRHLVMGRPLTGATIDNVDDFFYAVWGLGIACAMWALYQLGATGKHRLLRAAPLVLMLGGIFMFVGSLLDVVGLMTPTTNIFAGIAWLFILLGMLLVAILALVARTWAGWRKFTPLLCILAIPMLFVLAMAVGHWADPIVGFSWILLGFAVMTSQDATAVAQQAKAAV